VQLSEELAKWRADRPDEWKMDEFIRNAAALEQQLATAAAERDALAAQICGIKEAIDNLRAAKGYYARTTAWMVVNGAVSKTPAACLAQVKADVAQEYYYMGWEHSLSTKAEDGDHYACGRRLAKQLSDQIRQGCAR